MKDAKIHVAGPLVGSVQRCTRCHVRMNSNRPDARPVGWPVGPVVAHRHGASAGATEAQMEAIRPCGRRAA